ncbi:MAG: hypothetical protein AB1813_11900 [Verrucomicrobiota bacterium]
MKTLSLAARTFFSLFLISSCAIGQTQKIATHFPVDSPEVPAAVRATAAPKPWQGTERGPVANLQEFAREKSGAIWLGSGSGAARFDPKAKDKWDRWQYFAGRRWLRDDAVENIWVEPAKTRRVWVRTQSGVSLLEWRPMTLEAKALLFEERVALRHNRHGFVSDSHLRSPGDLTTNVMHDNDNDGLWTAMYIGAEAFRYAATRSPEARAKAQHALKALMRLEEITGVPGFYARSFVSKHEPRPQGGEWHWTPDGEWLWKGDTSSDESVGHYFAYAVYFDLVADAAEKESIRKFVSRMTDYLIQNDYDLLDLDGKPTRWGQWSERYYKTEEGQYEAALRSLELLSFLKTTHHITGHPKYAEAYADRIRRGYAEHMRHYRRWPGGGEINFSDDELAYLSYYPLLLYEKDPNLRAIYLDGLRFTWSQIRPEKNPLWNFISVACGAGKMTREIRADSVRTLNRIPMDLVQWTMKNSHRIDVTFQKENDRFARTQLTEVLAPDERAVSKWNGNPYRPDGGGNGHGEDDGAYFLLPYWMGRYYGWVGE